MEVSKMDRTDSLVTILNLHSSSPFKCQPYKMVKHIKTIRRLLPTNCVSVRGIGL